MKKAKKNGLPEQEIGRIASSILSTSIVSSAKDDGTFSVLARDLQDQKDEGIDFQIELLNRKTRTSVITFSLQSKGVDKKLKINSKGEGRGKISFPLEIKHVLYYRRYKPEAVVIALVDVSNKIVYWHPIQLDNDVDFAVEKALKKKSGQKHVTIYFDPQKQINQSNFLAFVQDMHLSTAAQSYRYNMEPPSELLPNPLPKTGRPLDDIYAHLREQYEYLKYIPLSLMSNSYPFRIGKDFLPMIGSFRMLTDNEEFFNLFESINIITHNTIEVIDDSAFPGVENKLEKIQKIMRWLTYNHVYFIFPAQGLKKKGYKSIYLLDEAYEEKPVVLFRRLNLKKLIELLKTDEYHKSTIEEAYVHFQLRNTLTAQIILKKVAENSSIGSIQQYLAYFNRKECYARFRQGYRQISEYSIYLRELQEVPLEITYRQCIHQRQKAAVGWIHHNSFIDEYQFKISEIVTEIRSKYYSHLKGGWSENNLLIRLQAEYGSFEGFITENFLFIDQYQIFKRITMLYTEGIIAAYAIRPGFGDRLDSFEDWMLEKILLHADAEKLRKLIKQYSIADIQYEKTGMDNDSITDLIDNLVSSAEELPSLLNDFTDGEHRGLLDFFNSRFSTMLILTGVLELEKSYIISLAKKMISLVPKEHIWPMQSRHYAYFFREKAKFLGSDLLKELLITIIKTKSWTVNDYIFSLANVANTQGLSMILSESEMTLLIEFFFDNENASYEYHERMELAAYLAYFIDSSSGQKDQWIIKLVDSLRTEFSECSYYSLAICDYIDFDIELLEKFKTAAFERSVKDDESNKSFFEKTGKEASGTPDEEFMGEQRIYFDQLIHLLYKYKDQYNLGNEEREKIENINGYYQWLMNLGTFDYSNFKPGWITRFSCSDYYAEFRKHPSLRHALETYLHRNTDQVVLSAYFMLYTESKRT